MELRRKILELYPRSRATILSLALEFIKEPKFQTET